MKKSQGRPPVGVRVRVTLASASRRHGAAMARKKTVEMTLGVCRRGGRRPWHATTTGDAAATAKKMALLVGVEEEPALL
ncbi:hypothetical protein GUJ93_ZPchr0013g34394 [Zizania palustris]|uniref:Uncharacterized protein n=1 Tax=Zizania palustris TaxID=103762 RepID=A0A8J5WS34_ZIZPA|nr:hypothetical protein GUJ93_ZPchr0013g34394 [Zizania palustris]